MSSATPFFTVIIPTRDRPAKLKVALESVAAQTCHDLEIIIVDDGSADHHRLQVEQLKHLHHYQCLEVLLPRRYNGHSASFARNSGASHMRGRYWANLDDDDQWTDPYYLERAKKSLTAGEKPIDLHLSNQAAYQGDRVISDTAWTAGLSDIVSSRYPHEADAQGAIDVSVAEIIRAGGFTHLNTLIVRKELFQKIGGMDESMRYEEDRDFFLRAIDAAERIVYSPHVVARHNVPDPSQKSNVTTRLSQLQKYQFQLYLLNKNFLAAKNPAIKSYCQKHGAYTLKKIAEELSTTGRLREARHYAWMGLAAKPTIGWLAYSILMTCRSLMSQSGNKRSGRG